MTNRPRHSGLSVMWSPDFDAYASGTIPAERVRCALCEQAPCQCPEFGSAEYFALVDRRHARPHSSPTVTSGGETAPAQPEPDGRPGGGPTRGRVT